LCVFFNQFAPQMLGHENILYTAFPTQQEVDGVMKTVYQIPFLICMGLAFFFTMVVMIGISLGGPRINPKAFALDKAMFKLQPSTLVLIIITLVILMALYVKFW